MTYAILTLLFTILDILNLLVIAWVILSLLINFDIVNRFSPIVKKVNVFLNRILDPLLKPIQKVLPPIAGIDLSPLILILAIQFLKNILISL